MQERIGSHVRKKQINVAQAWRSTVKEVEIRLQGFYTQHLNLRPINRKKVWQRNQISKICVIPGSALWSGCSKYHKIPQHKIKFNRHEPMSWYGDIKSVVPCWETFENRAGKLQVTFTLSFSVFSLKRTGHFFFNTAMNIICNQWLPRTKKGQNHFNVFNVFKRFVIRMIIIKKSDSPGMRIAVVNICKRKEVSGLNGKRSVCVKWNDF